MKRTLLVLTGIAVVASAAWAQAEPPKLGEGKGQVILSWDEFVKITGYDPAKKGSQMVTIPWTEVEAMLGVKVDRVGKGASVDLPWDEFKSLLEWSIRRKDSPPLPADFIVTSSQYAGTLTAEGASFTLTAKINLLRQAGWKRVPILPLTVALTDVKMPEGVFLNAAGGAYELLTDKAGPIEVIVQFAAAVQKSGGTNQANFARVLSGSSLVELTVAGDNVDVKVTGAQSLASTSAAGKTKVAAAVPSGAALAVAWERALPKIEAAPTKLYAETRTLVAVAEGLLLGQEMVNYNILHTPVRELSLQVPATASVLTVTGPDVQDWRVDKDGKLLVVLRGEVIGSYALRITYEQSSQAAAETPVIHPAGVERERGYVGVVALANVEIASEQATGATPIDVRQLPSDIVGMTNQPILLAFRYLGGKFSIPLTIKKHGEVSVLPTIVDSEHFTAMQLADGRRMTKVIYSVRNNRNQFLRLKMPEGAEIWSASVSGNMVSPAKDDQGNVLVPLVRSTAAAQELSAFPAEIVYVETPKAAPPESGKLHVDLPVCNVVPVMHVMYSLYVPAEGKYTTGLWGGGSAFSGPLEVVNEFTTLAAGPGRAVVQVDADQQAQQMQKDFSARVDAEAKAAGAAPIHVRLPINGKLFKLEKVLVLPGDKLYFDLTYSGWKVAK